jgi:Putative esterase
MMKRIVLALLFALSPLAHAADPQHCKPLNNIPDSNGEYCIYPGETNDVLYYLHGLDLSAEAWMEDSYYTGILRDYWKQKGKRMPTVIALSFGQKWLLSHKNPAPLGQLGLLDFVVNQWIPEVEKEIGGVKGHRLLLGESMGGFNSLQLAMHSNYFKRVAALCAPMGNGTITPFDSDDAMAAYIRSTIAWKYYGKDGESILFETAARMKQIAALFYADKPTFLDADPVTVAQTRGAPLPRDIYLSAGAYDNFLTYEGNLALTKQLEARGVNVDWHPQWGGHCVVDVPSVGDFLLK